MDKRKHKLFEAANGKNYLLPFVLVTTLFFLWDSPTAFLTY